MPDLLLELFSEEIPARMQAGAARDLERLVVGALSDRGLLFESFKAFAGPRRLTLAITGLPAKQKDVREELKGPKVDAPAAAIEGFLKKTGLTKDQLKVETTPKGEVYMAVIEREGRETSLVLAEILPEAMAKLPWPKSMRWLPRNPVRWVRPLHSILCTFDGEVVPFEFAGIQSGNSTRGHRFLSHGEITARRFDDYAAALKKAHMVLDAEERKAIIFEGVKQAAFVHGLEMIPDEGLLNEVAGLAEWPVVLIGRIEDQFMDVPPEILQTSMRTHQKYFSLRDPKSGKMANRFALVANMIAEDGGKEIIAGNERVLRARLSDAKFFWDEDRKQTLESRVEALKGIVFHAKLGTQYERVERIAKLASEIAAKIGADPKKAERAARLAKADLTSGVVGEFPELQGVMGRYYALHDKEDADVADAARDHYRPVGSSDAVPSEKISIAVALADKLDQVVGLFAVGERPTGSGDPFALRRSALGIVRIILHNKLRISVAELFRAALDGHLVAQQVDISASLEDFYDGNSIEVSEIEEIIRSDAAFFIYEVDGFWGDARKKLSDSKLDDDKKFEVLDQISQRYRALDRYKASTQQIADLKADGEDNYIVLGSGSLTLTPEDVESLKTEHQANTAVMAPFIDSAVRANTAFLGTRLTVDLRDKGYRHDLLDAVAAMSSDNDLVLLVARVEALQAFLKTDDGANLLAGYKRAANILKVEEKKDAKTFTSEVDESVLAEAAEKSLFTALGKAQAAIGPALEKEDFAAAMRQMAGLRVPVDTFFESVKVNADDPKVRHNRLSLLASFRATLHKVADFSKIEG